MPPAAASESTTPASQGAQIAYFSQAGVWGFFPATFAQPSCSAPAGQSQPQNARPQNSAPRNIRRNMIALPVKMPSAPPTKIRYGER
jgi:hypothetical protein